MKEKRKQRGRQERKPSLHKSAQSQGSLAHGNTRHNRLYGNADGPTRNLEGRLFLPPGDTSFLPLPEHPPPPASLPSLSFTLPLPPVLSHFVLFLPFTTKCSAFSFFPSPPTFRFLRSPSFPLPLPLVTLLPLFHPSFTIQCSGSSVLLQSLFFSRS